MEREPAFLERLIWQMFTNSRWEVMVVIDTVPSALLYLVVCWAALSSGAVMRHSPTILWVPLAIAGIAVGLCCLFHIQLSISKLSYPQNVVEGQRVMGALPENIPDEQRGDWLRAGALCVLFGIAGVPVSSVLGR